MKNRIRLFAAAFAAAFSLSAVAGGPPAGLNQPGKPDGIACQQAGISTLQALGLLAAVAKDGIYVVDLDTTLDLQTVLELHRTSPELFDGGAEAVTVRTPMGDVVAFWCGS